MTQPIPQGYQTVTPSLMFKDTQKALEFYKKAFNAKVGDLFPNLNGRGIMHATFQIGNSILMCGDEMPNSEKCMQSAQSLGGSPISLFVYVPNVDEVFKQAIAAGATQIFPVSEMFWGDRAGNLKDPFGYQWMIATHTRDLTPDQIKKEAETFFAQIASKK